MNISHFPSLAKRFVSDNSPIILTAIGVTGTITTAYLTAKATFKAAKAIGDAQFKHNLEEQSHDLTTKEKAELVWKLYIPAASTGVLTCGCIIGANRLGTRRTAAIAAAYSITERAFTEYKDKVVDRIGHDEEHAIRREIATDRVRKNPPMAERVFLGGGDVLCHDAYSGRYFMSDKETLRRAANDMGFEILHSDYASLSDFYNKIGLEPTSNSSEIGWNAEAPCELLFSAVETPDGKPCLSYDFAVIPVANPWRFR